MHRLIIHRIGQDFDLKQENTTIVMFLRQNIDEKADRNSNFYGNWKRLQANSLKL